MKRFILGLSLITFLCGTVHAAEHGFVVFSRSATHAYEFGPDKTLRLAATGPVRYAKDHIACAGRVFGVNCQRGRICRLGPDLKEDRTAELGKVNGFVRLVGADDDRLYVFFDNTLAGFDGELKSVGRVLLEPKKLSEIVPVISVNDFKVFVGKGYLLTDNTGDVFTVDLKSWTAVRTRLPGERVSARTQWIDPGDQTLNILVSRKREEHTPELEAEAKRVIKNEVVVTYDLRNQGNPPRETAMHDEREIHKPYPPEFYEHWKQERAHGRISDYRPPYRWERRPEGVYISQVSATTPCFAEVFTDEKDSSAGLRSRDFVLLGSGGKTTSIECFRDEKHNVVWFKHDGAVRVLAPKIREQQLNLQSAAYINLLEIPGTAGTAVLAY